ncbi:MAG: substrate-binding periplasmic protein, partial [Flammeovirgaceae bacterium]
MSRALIATSVTIFAFALCTFFSVFGQRSFSWKEAQQTKKGTITVYWFPNKPFTYWENGSVTGVEVEVMSAFVRYLKEKYNIALDVKWVAQLTFKDVMNHMRHDSVSGILGAASFSISNERRKFMKFSRPFMADVMVLVSTSDIPIVRGPADMAKCFDGATALTSQGTINERELIALRSENDLDFQIRYTGGSQETIDSLKIRKKSFSYLSLPVYLMSIGNNTGNLQRHNYLTKRFEGRAIGLPIVSDWD